MGGFLQGSPPDSRQRPHSSAPRRRAGLGWLAACESGVEGTRPGHDLQSAERTNSTAHPVAAVLYRPHQPRDDSLGRRTFGDGCAGPRLLCGGNRKCSRPRPRLAGGGRAGFKLEKMKKIITRLRRLGLSATCWFVLAGWVPAANAKSTFVIGDSDFLLAGKPFQIKAGEMHPGRIPHEYWADRLKMAHALGLNTVSIYVFWNQHEPREGRFNFTGDADIAQFVRLAQKEGLWVILRPGPYCCAEWEFGGYPWWLLKEHDLKVRSQDPRFLAAAETYMKKLGEQLAPLQITQGGPIILVQVENEYGSYAGDHAYMGKIRDLDRAAGFEVPLFTADG